MTASCICYALLCCEEVMSIRFAGRHARMSRGKVASGSRAVLCVVCCGCLVCAVRQQDLQGAHAGSGDGPGVRNRLNLVILRDMSRNEHRLSSSAILSTIIKWCIHMTI